MGEKIKVPKAVPEQIVGAIVFKTRSDTRAGLFHFTICAPGFEMCSCEGHRYHKDCKHLKHARGVLQDEAERKGMQADRNPMFPPKT